MDGKEHGEVSAELSTALPPERDKREDAEAGGSKADDKKGQAMGSPEKTKGKSRMSTGEYLLIGFSVVLILIVVGGGMFIWARYGTPGGGNGITAELSEGTLYPLKPFFVPLSAANGSEKFLSVNISLELSNKHAKEFVKYIEKVRGSILQILITAAPKELEYSHGKKALIDKIIADVNLSLESAMVAGLRFTDVVIL